jgi:hypothetical protein
MCNYAAKTVDIVRYNSSTAAQSNGKLYIGDSLSKSVYQIFTGYDDMGQTVDAYWIGKDESYSSERLKKFRKLRFSGHIDPGQAVEVHISYDNSGFSQVGTILGAGPYVNYTETTNIGGPLVGGGQIGGDDIAESYPFFMEIKVKTPKFRNKSVKLIPKGIGYFDLDSSLDFDILTFENRLPKLYREKQNVSIDGLTSNLDNPQ